MMVLEHKLYASGVALQALPDIEGAEADDDVIMATFTGESPP